MATENPFPLEISDKEDSWEKIQALENIDVRFFLKAAEFNTIKQALQYLYENISGGVGPGTFQESLPATVVQTVTDYKMKNTHGDFYFMNAPTDSTEVNIIELGGVGSNMRIRYNFNSLTSYPVVTADILITAPLNFIDDLGDFDNLSPGKYDLFCEYDGSQINYFFRFIQE